MSPYILSYATDPLDVPACLAFTRSPTAGANVLFLGTTRDNFDDRPVTRLSYSAYPKLALKSLFAIAEDVKAKHDLERVYIAHRLGEVAIEEESIAVFSKQWPPPGRLEGQRRDPRACQGES